jgi:hypothetical protein
MPLSQSGNGRTTVHNSRIHHQAKLELDVAKAVIGFKYSKQLLQRDPTNRFALFASAGWFISRIQDKENNI